MTCAKFGRYRNLDHQAIILEAPPSKEQNLLWRDLGGAIAIHMSDNIAMISRETW